MIDLITSKYNTKDVSFIKYQIEEIFNENITRKEIINHLNGVKEIEEIPVLEETFSMEGLTVEMNEIFNEL